MKNMYSIFKHAFYVFRGKLKFLIDIIIKKRRSIFIPTNVESEQEIVSFAQVENFLWIRA